MLSCFSTSLRYGSSAINCLINILLPFVMASVSFSAAHKRSKIIFPVLATATYEKVVGQCILGFSEPDLV